MQISIPVYIKPNKGQGIYDLATEIFNEKAKGNIGDKVFLTLPNGSDIEIRGDTVEQIRDSIAMRFIGSHF